MNPGSPSSDISQLTHTPVMIHSSHLFTSVPFIFLSQRIKANGSTLIVIRHSFCDDRKKYHSHINNNIFLLSSREKKLSKLFLKYVVSFDHQEKNHRFKIPQPLCSVLVEINAVTQRYMRERYGESLKLIWKVNGKLKDVERGAVGILILRKRSPLPRVVKRSEDTGPGVSGQPGLFVSTELICIQ